MTRFERGGLIALVSLCTIFSEVGSAQLRPPFTTLDSAIIGGEFFYPQSHNTVQMPDPYSDQHILTASQCASLFMSFSRASLDSTHLLSDFSRYRESKDSVAHSEGYRSIALLDILYSDLHADALTAGMIYRENGMFYHNQNCEVSPCIQREGLALWVDASIIPTGIFRFALRQEDWITNYEDFADSLLIDFDDGLGFRVLQTDVIYTVNYSDELRNRTVRCELWRDGYPVKRAACRLRSEEEFDVCATGTFPFPQAPPWSVNTENPWDIQVSTEYGPSSGRAYTLTSSDGVFDKPFLFIEGIDFGLDRSGHPIHEEYRHGTFGWCEFSSGFQDPDVNDDLTYGYDDLHLMPVLLNELRARGYDLVLVDFYDGAQRLEMNARLVQEVIRLCNMHKQGQEALVVAGASMGGVISRFALRDMELHGEDHCTRLWISFDAPHAGAHIPRAIQESIRFYANHGQERAQLFRDRYLLRPAARQMLVEQAFTDGSDFNAWYGLLSEMGYPQQCRRIAVSNGRPDGEGLQYAQERLLDWGCYIMDMPVSHQYLFHEGGNPYHHLSSGALNLVAEFHAPVAGLAAIGDEWFYWMGGLALGLLDAVDIDHYYVLTPSGTVNRDYAPGGKRNTVQSLVTAINTEIASIEEGLSIDLPCNGAFPDDYNRDHAFVLSTSSIGMWTEDPYINLEQYVQENPEAHHFHRVKFALSHNENHTELTETNLAFVLEETLGPDLAGLDTVLSASSINGGEFNYGKPEFTQVKDVKIHDGGKLKFNAYQPTHFNLSGDYLSTAGHFEAHTLSCSPAWVRIATQGSLEIGDPTAEYRTASLTLTRDSRMSIESGGTLRIFEGSTLILEEGSLLEVYPGGKLDIVRGSLIVKEGAILRFINESSVQVAHDIRLSGSESRLLIDGGILQLDARVTLSMDQDVDETGYMELLTGTENALHMDTLSCLNWSGHGMDDLILKMINGAHLQNANWSLGSITLSEGKVELTYHGAIYTDVLFRANGVHFYANDQWEAEHSEVWVWSSMCTVDSCLFEHVDLHAVNSKSIVSGSDFLGPNAGFTSEEGVYEVDHCIFNQSFVRSEYNLADARIRGCSFTSDAFILDESEAQLRVEDCSFNQSNLHPVEKFGGKLTLRCNEFESTEAVAVHEAFLNLSSLANAGYNKFNDVPVCVLLDQARGIYLLRGYNDFSSYGQFVIQGTLDTVCTDYDCQIMLDAHYNYWGNQVAPIYSSHESYVTPTSSMFDVTASEWSYCSGYEQSGYCPVLFEDLSPVQVKDCPTSSIEERMSEVVPSDEFPETYSRESASSFADIFMHAQSIQLFDMQGRCVFEGSVNGSYSMAIAELSLSHGVYLLCATDECGSLFHFPLRIE